MYSNIRFIVSRYLPVNLYNNKNKYAVKTKFMLG